MKLTNSRWMKPFVEAEPEGGAAPRGSELNEDTEAVRPLQLSRLTGTLVLGSAADDELAAAGTGEVLSGLSGRDVARFAGRISDYRLVTQGGALLVRHGRGLRASGLSTLLSIEMLRFGNASVGLVAPIVLDLDGNGVKLRSAKAGARFDMDGDGVAERTGWIGAGDGFLVLDRNGNGRVHGALEISFVDDKPGARSDLDGLTAFDSNGDRVLSRADRRFSEFKIWREVDGDGRTGERELVSLTEAGVLSISLAGTPVDKTAKIRKGAVINTLSFTRTDGRQGEAVDAVIVYSKVKPVPLSSGTTARPIPHNFEDALDFGGAGLRLLKDAIGDFGAEPDRAGLSRADRLHQALMPAAGPGSSELNRLVQAMAAFGGTNDKTASDSINWRGPTEALHYGLIAAPA